MLIFVCCHISTINSLHTLIVFVLTSIVFISIGLHPRHINSSNSGYFLLLLFQYKTYLKQELVKIAFMALFIKSS